MSGFQEETKCSGRQDRFSSDNGRQCLKLALEAFIDKAGEWCGSVMLNVEQEKSMAVLNLWK